MAHSFRFFAFVGLLGLLAAGRGQAQSRVLASTQKMPVTTQKVPVVAPKVPVTAQKTPVTAPDVAPAPAAPAVYPDSVYINPEVRPQFTGGDKAFGAYLSKNIRYPQQALQRHISGRVFVNFVLNAQGRVQDAHVISGPGNGLNDEALRLVWLMPAWEPARVNGVPVRVACTIPISFTSDR